MTDPEGNPLTALADDWSYRLGQAFLTAATSCGATCDRKFVSDGGPPESPPPGSCECQLAVVVTEGWRTVSNSAGCAAQRVAEIRLVLDLCSPVAEQTAVRDPAKINANAQANATTRWLIMRGLRDAWTGGDLATVGEPSVGPLAKGMCRRITPGSWRVISDQGGVARWETLWTFTDHE